MILLSRLTDGPEMPRSITAPSDWLDSLLDWAGFSGAQALSSGKIPFLLLWSNLFPARLGGRCLMLG